MHKVTILLCKTPTHFSARKSLNYEILSEMFFQCFQHRVLGYSEFVQFSFPRHSDDQLLSLFLTQ
jgi:hypothetical protein